MIKTQQEQISWLRRLHSPKSVTLQQNEIGEVRAAFIKLQNEFKVQQSTIGLLQQEVDHYKLELGAKSKEVQGLNKSLDELNTQFEIQHQTQL